MKDSLYALAVLAITYHCCHHTTYAQQQQQQQSIDDVLTALGEETIRFRDEVKSLLTTTTSTTSSGGNEPSCDWLTSCINKNYDHCYSKFPNEACRFNSTLLSSNSTSNDKSVCSPCGSKVDSTISAVRIASDSKNLDDDTKFNIFHDICTTRILDDKYFKDKSISDDNGIRAMYFGSVDGMFRIYPATYAQSKSDSEQATCRPYDPTIRPWYTAVTSIERNVILLVDMSLSHIDDAFGNRLQNMKDATIRIISSTTIADKIWVILFNETSISVIDGNNRFGTIQNKKLLTETVTNLTLSFDTNTNASSVVNRTAVYEKALEVSNDSRCGGTAILLITNDVKNTKDAIQIMDPTFVQYELSTGKSILNFIFLTELSDTALYTFDCIGNTFRTGIYSTIATIDEIGKGLSVYFKVFQKAYEIQQTVKLTSGSTDVAWVEVYEFYESGQLGTTASASIYDDTTGQLLGVVGIDNTVDDIQQLTNTSTIDNIIEKIEFLAGNKDNTDICFNFTLLIPCNFQFYTINNTTNTVLCSEATTTTLLTTNFTCGSTNLTNETTTPTIFNNVTRRSSTINTINNAKECCTSNLIANACNVIDETSILWNNVKDYGKTYTERACCTFQNSSNSDDDGVCIANSSTTEVVSPTIPTVSSTSMPVSKPSDAISQNKTTTTTRSSTSKATSGGAIFGYVTSGVVVLGVITFILFVRHKNYQKQSNQNHTIIIPDSPKRTRPPPVPPMYDD